jgi:hypothetical protein
VRWASSPTVRIARATLPEKPTIVVMPQSGSWP